MNIRGEIELYALRFWSIKKTLIVNVFVCVGLCLMLGGATNAQSVRASQKGTVSQRVANTEIIIEYSRPSARGRVLFGPKGIVKYRGIWMPGANEASNIKITGDVVLNGAPLAAGRYSFWTIPGEDEWTIILSKDWDQWHTRYPGKDKDALRFNVSPKEGSHMEMMTFYFPLVTKNSASINLHWGKIIIPFEIKLAEEK